MIEPIRQDQAYHDFADERSVLGIANAFDTLSSLAFVVVGVAGLLVLWRPRGRSLRFGHASEARAYWVLFAAVAATGVGSAYYHQTPDDARLVWDRLPMAVAFMALLAAVIGERLSRSAGRRLLVPFVLLGAASVAWWAWLDDLWPYAIVQFGSAVALLVIAVLFPSRYTQGNVLYAVLGLYGIAKFCELQDRAIYELGHWVSGHTLKHLVAALAGGLIVLSLARRRLRDGPRR